MTELDSIARKIMNEALLQEELSSWRNSMSRYTLELEGMRRSLDGFREFLVDYGASKKAKSKLEHIRSRVKKTLAHAVSSYATMRAEMSILDSRRSIAEAESVGKLTELVFIFIPITFAASAFSMQIKELQNAVPLRSFIIACIITLVCSYGLRLLVRSRLLRRSMQRLIEDVREYAEVQPNRPIPTRKFISFILVKQRILHIVLASAIVAVPVIVPLWTNTNLDGFSSNFSDPCYPTDWATAKTNYYSPGVCPEDHTYAGVFSAQSLGTPYTSVNCCPSGMDFWDTTQCRTLINTSTYALLPNSETSATISLPFTGFATPVTVVWGPEDLSLFTPNAAPAIAVADKEKEDAVGLSVGAKAGIGLGVALGILLLIGVSTLAASRIRKRRVKRLKVTSNSSSYGDFKPELPGDESVEGKTMPELDDQTESREMEGDAMFPELAHLIKPSELEVPHKVHELPG
ncbi:hypothetical protein KCU71_g3536, partial [Aureobasidium melanogenum]